MSGHTPSLGALNQRVELLNRTTSTDATGGQSTTYSSLGFTWAQVELRAAGVGELGEANAANLSAQITIRFRSDVQPGDRILFDAKQFDITNVADINGRRAYLTCWCAAPTMIGSQYE